MTRNTNHNDVQEVIHSITGYSAYEDCGSAKDEGYYECKGLVEKLAFIMQYNDYVDGIKLTLKDCYIIYDFINTDHANSSDRYHEFTALNSKKKISKNCCVRLPPLIHEQAKIYAYCHGMTIQEFIYALIVTELNKDKDHEKSTL